jgi:branched-chain amino acid transport system substrate-binding protein
MILMAGPAASASITGANFTPDTFRACRNGAQDFIALASVLKSSGVKKIVVLAADYDFGRSGAQSAEAAYKPLGLDFAPAIFAPQNTTDFTPYLQQVLASGADALQPIWAGESSVTLYQQIAELGVTKKMTLINAFNSNPIVKASTTAGQVGGIGFIVYHYTLPKTQVNDWLVQNHQKDYNGTFPDLFTECGFATAQALVGALEKTKGDTSTTAMIPALEGLSWEGPRGTYYIRPSDHQVLLPAYIVKLTNVTDPDYKYYELVKQLGALESAPPCALPDKYKDRCSMPMNPPASMSAASATMAATMAATAGS